MLNMSKNTNNFRRNLSVSLVGLTVSVFANERPNIILILADDMGYSDIGCYGGEISTPNIDHLAENGIRFKHFYNGARSCPTRAALITGLFAQQAGVGWMTNAYEGEGSYQGDLSKNAVTIAEYLKSGGYNTYMSGKWHVSSYRKNNANIKDNWPSQRGFDKFFGIVGGAANYFTPTVFSNNTKYKAPANFYLTDAISDSAANYIRENNEEPFFLYLAYTAPHWPLHARPDDIAKYNGKYDIGWDQIRANRLQKQLDMDLIDQKYLLTPRDSRVNAWVNESNKNDFAKRMQIYAAQIDVMDEGIGRVINALEETGQLENTLIMFLSDNGACDEFQSSGESKELNGAANTYESYRVHWANASNTPYREYKHYAHEGGIKTPFVVYWPNGITKEFGSFVNTPGHIIDVFKTIEDITKIPYPENYNNYEITPLQGESMLPLFKGNELNRGPMFWEHESNLAIRIDNWKLVAKTPIKTVPIGKLELYDLANDPTELNNLASKQPTKVNDLWSQWYQWAEEKKVFPFSTVGYDQRQVNDKRYLNGEFDAGLNNWTFQTQGTGVGSVTLDTLHAISGKYSAKITVERTGAKPNNILLYWKTPLIQNERCKIRFKAKANVDNVEMMLRLEKNGGNFAKIIDLPVIINKEIAEYEFDSQLVPITEDNRLGFYFGSSIPSQIWLDAVELVFINEPSLSPTWDFNVIEGASYKLNLEGVTTQFQVPVKINIRSQKESEKIYFSTTIKLIKEKQQFNIPIPDPLTDDKIFIELEIPPYATKDIIISNIQLKIDYKNSIKKSENESEYSVEYRNDAYYIIPVNSNKVYSYEIFDFSGKLIECKDRIQGTTKLTCNQVGIIRIKESHEIKLITKLISQ